ncbi:MAG: tetratricopeptide repeat protein [Pirellulales bacterium]
MLAAWRWDVLRDPPFFECATGLYMEANFLAETNFDYSRLRFDEIYVAEGGPYAYMTSALPTMIALVMRATARPSDVFLVFHLFSIACASIVLTCAYAIVQPRGGRLLAALCAAALATTPLFSAQIDMLGMDLPMTAFAVVAALLLLEGWCLSAILAGLLAYAMKPTGALVTVATIVYLFAQLVWSLWPGQRRDANWRYPLLAVGGAVVAFGLELAIYRWGGINDKLLGLATDRRVLNSVWIVCPDLMLLGLAALVGTALVAFRLVGRLRDAKRRYAPSCAADRECLQAIALSWLMICGTMAAIVRYGFVPPRYFTLIVPFLLVCVGLLLSTPVRTARWGAVAVALLVLFNLGNWDGKFFPKLDEVTAWSRGGDRSRAYLSDQRSTMAAMHEIEVRGAGARIVVGHPYTYFLALPRMGYVSQPQRGYSINAFVDPNFPNWYRAFKEKPTSLIFVSVRNHYYHSGLARIPPPAQGDEILFRSDDPSPLIVYRKHFSKAAWESGDADRWIVENTWYDPSDPNKSVLRAKLLATIGRPDLAAMLLRLEMSAGQPTQPVRLELGRMLMQSGQFVDAKAQFDAVLRDDPQHVEARLERASLAELSGSTTLAERLFREVIQTSPPAVEARFRLAMLLLKKQDASGAAELLQECVRHDPDNLTHRNALGVSLAQMGRLAEARQQFQAVLAVVPGHATTLANLRRLDELEATKMKPPPTGDH